MKNRWLDLYPDEFHTCFSRMPVAYMAYGCAEPHGAYGALGLDYGVADALIDRVAGKVGGIIAPPMAWHMLEVPGNDWEMQVTGMAGRMSNPFPAALFLENVLNHLRVFDARGFHAAVLVSGHYVAGLNEDMQLLAQYYRLKTGTAMRILVGYPPDFLSQQEAAALAMDEDHAGRDEISLAMALDKHLVELERVGYRGVLGGGQGEFGPYCAPRDFPNGRWAPDGARGQQLADALAGALEAAVWREVNAWQPATRAFVPNQTQLEGMWAEFCGYTRRYWQCLPTRRQEMEGQHAPAFPGWKAVGARFDGLEDML
nr:creatininase family protein [bacterium]